MVALLWLAAELELGVELPPLGRLDELADPGEGARSRDTAAGLYAGSTSSSDVVVASLLYLSHSDSTSLRESAERFSKLAARLSKQ